MHVTAYVHGGKRTIGGSQFSSSTEEAPGIESKLVWLGSCPLSYLSSLSLFFDD